MEKSFVGIRTSHLLLSKPMLHHLSYFGSYEIPFKCYRWTGKCVLSWGEFLNINHTLKPLITKHKCFVSKIWPYKAHITINGSVATRLVREKTPNIWDSYAQNFVYDNFHQPKWDTHSVFLNLICTVWKDWKFIYGVKLLYVLNSN